MLKRVESEMTPVIDELRELGVLIPRKRAVIQASAAHNRLAPLSEEVVSRRCRVAKS